MSAINSTTNTHEIGSRCSSEQENAKFISFLLQEGQQRVGLAKETPAEGPRLKHWFALYLNELNVAVERGNREGIKDAMRNIFHMQNVMEKSQNNNVSEDTKRISEICNNRINQIDSDQSLRKEITTWSGYLKANVLILKSLAKAGLLGGGLYVILKIPGAISNSIESAFGSEVAQATFLSLTAMNFYRSVKSRNLIGIACTGYLLYDRVTALYNQSFPPDKS